MSTTEIKRLADQASQYDATHNEGAEGYNAYDDKHDQAVKAAADARLEAVIADFPAISARWNAAVAQHTVNGKLSPLALPQIEKAVGVTFFVLAAAKARIGA